MAVVVGAVATTVHTRAQATTPPLQPAQPLSEKGIDAIVAKAVGNAEKQWVAAGVDENRAKALAQDVRVVLKAILAKDFEPYRQMMAAREMRLGPAAEGVVTEMRASAFRSDTDEVWKSTDVARKFAYVWAHPERRAAEIVDVSADSASAGIGWVVEEEKAPMGGPSCVTAFSLPRQAEFFNSAQTKGPKNAWLRLPSKFRDGSKADLRLNFAYDEETKHWYPMRIDARGGEDQYLLF
jgi:hypothetical protein